MLRHGVVRQPRSSANEIQQSFDRSLFTYTFGTRNHDTDKVETSVEILGQMDVGTTYKIHNIKYLDWWSRTPGRVVMGPYP